MIDFPPLLLRALFTFHAGRHKPIRKLAGRLIFEFESTDKTGPKKRPTSASLMIGDKRP